MVLCKCIGFHIYVPVSALCSIDMLFLQTTHIFNHAPKSSLRIFKEISCYNIILSSFLKIKHPSLSLLSSATPCAVNADFEPDPGHAMS
jgi:hypothetical protein